MAVNTILFADALAAKYDFFAGVPDSLLKDLCAALSDRLPPYKFVTAVNEGSAVAMSAGYTLASGKPGVVYMQNSGLGNSINPLLSLNDELVYHIPVLLIIGWRGEPYIKDEPQHKKQGLITRELLDVCGIPARVLTDISDMEWADRKLKELNSPVALLVKKNTFDEYEKVYANGYVLRRETAIETILNSLEYENYRIVSTTGMISRELYALREKRGELHDHDFLTVGSMGHASAIAMGLALQLPDTKIICLDGDGAALMHMGSMASIGTSGIKNIIHIMLNNEAHDSVGGQPTIAGAVSLTGIAESCGYSSAVCVNDRIGLKKVVSSAHDGINFIEVKIAVHTNTDLMRPPGDLVKQKNLFMRRK